MKASRKKLIQEIIKEGYHFAIHEYRGVTFVPVRVVKRKVMKKLKINRFEFDKILLSEGRPNYHTEGLNLASCGSRVGGNLNYVTRDYNRPTFMNSFCFFQINPEFAKELERDLETK